MKATPYAQGERSYLHPKHEVQLLLENYVQHDILTTSGHTVHTNPRERTRTCNMEHVQQQETKHTVRHRVRHMYQLESISVPEISVVTNKYISLLRDWSDTR